MTAVFEKPITGRHVYEAIVSISSELAATGIKKNQKNEQQGFRFRGIDSVLNALAPLLAKHRVCILPYVVDRQVTERVNNKGTALFYTTLTVDYHFVSAVDGSRHIVRAMGEAMDSGDKSLNKGMSAAYKYMCFQAFCIPTEGDNDADATTHTVAARKAPAPPAGQGFASMTDDEWQEWQERVCRQAAECESLDALTTLKRRNGGAYRFLNEHQPKRAAAFVAACNRRKAELEGPVVLDGDEIPDFPKN